MSCQPEGIEIMNIGSIPQTGDESAVERFDLNFLLDDKKARCVPIVARTLKIVMNIIQLTGVSLFLTTLLNPLVLDSP